MSIKIESVEITPNPVSTGEKFIISVKVTQSTWDWLKKFTWNTAKGFMWNQAKNGEIK